PSHSYGHTRRHGHTWSRAAVDGWQKQAHTGAHIRRAFHHYVSAQFANVLLTFIRTDPHSGLLGRLERLEQPLAHEFLSHAVPCVTDLDNGIRPLTTDSNPHFSIRWRGVDRVLREVTDHPFETIIVAVCHNRFEHLQLDRGFLWRFCNLHLVRYLGEVHALRARDRGGSVAELKHELLHTIHRMRNGHQHVLLKLRVVPMPFGIAQHQRQLGNDVLEIVDYECRHSIER